MVYKKGKPAQERLINLRQEKGLTQSEVAQKAGISESYYCQLENGARRMSLDMAIKIAAILESTPNDIFL